MYSSSLSTSCLSNPYLRDCFFLGSEKIRWPGEKPFKQGQEATTIQSLCDASVRNGTQATVVKGIVLTTMPSLSG